MQLRFWARSTQKQTSTTSPCKRHHVGRKRLLVHPIFASWHPQEILPTSYFILHTEYLQQSFGCVIQTKPKEKVWPSRSASPKEASYSLSCAAQRPTDGVSSSPLRAATRDKTRTNSLIWQSLLKLLKRGHALNINTSERKHVQIRQNCWRTRTNPVTLAVFCRWFCCRFLIQSRRNTSNLFLRELFLFWVPLRFSRQTESIFKEERREFLFFFFATDGEFHRISRTNH